MGDLSVTALYTCQTWISAGLGCAELFAMPDAKGVFDATNAALALSRKLRPELPSLRASLLARHAMIDHVLAATAPRRVLELAAGFSARGARTTNQPGVEYVELDLPNVARKKRALLEATAAGRAVLARVSYRLQEGDALVFPLDAALRGEGPRLVIAEGLVPYLDANARRTLFTRVAAALREAGGGTFVFERVPDEELPAEGAVGGALGWAMRRFTKGQGFAKDAKSRAVLRAELATAGFDEVVVTTPADDASALGAAPAGERAQVVLFVARVA
jgi:O-methyltransferase involved in polyketide biosynthesis